MAANFFRIGFILLFSFYSVHGQQAKWKFETGGRIFATVAIDQNHIFVGSEDQYFYAIDKKNGNEIWKFKTEGAVHSSATIKENLVIFGSADGSLYALNKTNGSSVWAYKSEGEKKYGLWDYYLSSPKIDNELVYWGSGDGNLYALNWQTGTLKWKFKTEGIVHASPVVDGDVLFIGSFDGFLYALNKNSGELIWKFDTLGAEYFPKGEIQRAVAVDDKSVYFGSRDYNIYALNKETGAVKWNVREPGGWIISTPLIAKDQILFGSSDGHRYYCLNKNYGYILWDTFMSGRVFGSSVVYGDKVYFGCFDGKVIGLDLATGEKSNEFQSDGSKKNYNKIYDEEGKYNQDFINSYGKDLNETEKKILDLGAFLATPVLEGNMVYIGSADSTLYAIELD